MRTPPPFFLLVFHKIETRPTTYFSALITDAAWTNDDVRLEVSGPSRQGDGIRVFQQHTKVYGVASESAVNLLNLHLQIVRTSDISCNFDLG